LLYLYLAVTLAIFNLILACLALALESLRGRPRLYLLIMMMNALGGTETWGRNRKPPEVRRIIL
jgi:uncharacterized membrane-anchored protein